MFQYCVLLLLFLACGVECNHDNACQRRQESLNALAFSYYLIEYVYNNYPSCSMFRKAADCLDVQEMGHNTSGVYTIWPMNRLTDNKSIDVYCDLETDGGGWTVIQRRGPFGNPEDYFYKDWYHYKVGFGNISEDFWLGNDYIFALTNQRLYSARFDLKDVEGNSAYALYDEFWIDDENNKYTLHISNYSGDAGDSMIEEQNNQKFTTKDQDNDKLNNAQPSDKKKKKKDKHDHDGGDDEEDVNNCAQLFKGAWWYKHCHQSNLNGLYHRGQHDSFADGVNWFTWRGYHESLEATEIKIRPKSFK